MTYHQDYAVIRMYIKMNINDMRTSRTQPKMITLKKQASWGPGGSLQCWLYLKL